MAQNALTAVALSSSSSLPSVATRELDRLEGRLSNAVDWEPGDKRFVIATEYAPTPAERSVLEARRHELRAALAPASEAEIGRSVSFLRSNLATQNSTDQATAVLTTRSTVDVLKGFPAWVVKEASTRVMRGTAGFDPQYAPKAPQLAQLCRSIAAPYREELAQVDKILRARVAPPVDEVMRARIERGLREFAAEMRARNPGAKGFRPADLARRDRGTVAAEAARTLGVSVEEFNKIPDAPGRVLDGMVVEGR